MDRIDDIAAQLAFVGAHPAGPFDVATARFIVERMVLRGDGVFDRRGGDARVVAALVEGADNAADAAELTVLGVCGADEAVLALVQDMVPEAWSLAREGPRACLDVPMRGRLEPLGADFFERHGFAVAYVEYDMATRDAAFVARAPPPGTRWIDLDARWVDAVHPLLAAAFAGVPGFMLASAEEMRARLLAREPPARLLVDEAAGVLVAQAQVAGPDEAGVGTVRTLARAPERRAQGLGDVVLGEAMRLLAARGATRFALNVAADNARALRLYERHGFTVTGRDTVWRKALDAPGS